MRDDLEIDETVFRSIEAVTEDGVTEKQFADYVANVKELKQRFCKREVKVDVKDKRVVNECILEMRECEENGHKHLYGACRRANKVLTL